jgi:hypothetical protein
MKEKRDKELHDNDKHHKEIVDKITAKLQREK